MDIELILPSLTTIFVLLIVGFVCGKFGFSDTDFTKKLTSLLLKTILPVNIFFAIVQPFDQNKLVNCIFILFLSFGVYICAHILAIIITKVLRISDSEKGLWKFAMVFPNCAFIGFPILDAVVGSDGIFYGGIANIAYNVYAFTVGIFMINSSNKGKHKIKFKEIYLNPVNIATAIGLVCFISSVGVPNVIAEPLMVYGSLMTPLSMFILGATLSRMNIRESLLNFRAYAINFFRLIFVPVIISSIIIILPIDQVLKEVLVVLAAMPAATMTLLFAEQYDCDVKLAASIVFISNILCMITIPVLLVVLF
ncbi:AEC family transporter [Candidatus Epulonipiscium viviparus]|uniref:AEC family transporter n=1 Tax=Candidatus Epulonipiscium viviparus TaxID=420336 RepID=UPI0027380809|nr:AEC family transporter [Candidatus Epulopiscium viviparus]